MSADIGPRIRFITLSKAQRNSQGRFERYPAGIMTIPAVDRNPKTHKAPIYTYLVVNLVRIQTKTTVTI